LERFFEEKTINPQLLQLLQEFKATKAFSAHVL